MVGLTLGVGIVVLQEYTKSQALGLINLVATANNWKRKIRVDMVDRIEAGDL